MLHSPADIILELLQENDQLELFDGTPWPGFVAHLPNSPDACVAVFDTLPLTQARVLGTGVTIRRWGFMLRLRTGRRDYTEGWTKITGLDDYLVTVHNRTVTFSDVAYKVTAITNEGGPTFNGQEDEQSRRNIFTDNFLFSLRTI